MTKEEYQKEDALLREQFEKKQFSIGNKIKLHYNPCSLSCGCYYNKQAKQNIVLEETLVYTVKKIHYFGGGCPPVFLEIEELPQTHSYDTALPANWFKTIKSKTVGVGLNKELKQTK